MSDYRRSSFCASGACVEVAHAPDWTLLRDGGHAIRISPDAWDAFVAGVKAGEFDRPGPDLGSVDESDHALDQAALNEAEPTWTPNGWAWLSIPEPPAKPESRTPPSHNYEHGNPHCRCQDALVQAVKARDEHQVVIRLVVAEREQALAEIARLEALNDAFRTEREGVELKRDRWRDKARDRKLRLDQARADLAEALEDLRDVCRERDEVQAQKTRLAMQARLDGLAP